MEKLQIEASPREKGRKAREIRKQGLIPAVVYNHGQTQEISVSRKELHRIFSHGVSESTLIEMNLSGKTETVFVKEFQVHPVSEEILHVDFYRVTYGEKIRTHIPLHLVGKAIGVVEGGVLETFLHEVEVEILPKDLMPAIEVDVTNLKIGDALHVDDLKLPESAKVLTEGNPIICHVSHTPKARAEEGAGAEAETEAEGAEAAPSES
ncbi:MAG: 50S ribosomal protein L25 [Candidatus Hydrogenedentota bacterium]|nr:MAG: 50S ribosomal protein L25 [Candidatus Hydrogenedentota bacterium]